ncbi:hypothetical protein D3C72_502060 [compost metagenome]
MKMKKVLPLSLAGAMAVALTACNLNGLPTKTNTPAEGTVEGNIKGNIGTPTTGQPGSVQTNPNLATSFAKPNATVSGKLLDSDGKPVADAFVFAANGQVVKTAADGSYSIAVTAETGKQVNLIFQKDGYVFSSELVTLNPGDKVMADASVKKLDQQVVSVNAATGGTFKNYTGVLEVDVPANALTGNAQMSMTPLSFGQAGLPNELPGSLETVDETGARMLLMPAEYWSIDLQGANLKEGETITMRMKLPNNPDAPVKLKAGDMIPCYIYDAKLGYWNSPNLGPVVEKDGALWATYEIKASALTNRTDVIRNVQHIHTGSASNPLSEDQLVHNAEHLRDGANNSLGGLQSAGGGVIGGHTYFPLFGTNMRVKITDWDGTALTDASVNIHGGGNPGQAGHIGGGTFSRLQYRSQNVKVKAYVSDYCQGERSESTQASNKVPAPLNQFGYSTGDLMESRNPENANWTEFKFDTRHNATLSFTGTAATAAAPTMTYTLNDQPITYQALTNTRHLVRGKAYTLKAKGNVDQGSSSVTFTIPGGHTKGAPFPVSLKFALDAEAVK